MSTTAEAPDTTEEHETVEPVEAPENPDEEQEGSELDDDESAPHEPAKEPAQVLSEKQLNAAFEKLAREGKRHRDRLDEIMGEDAWALVECPLCTPEMAGWRFPVEPDDETKDAVRAAIGDLVAADLAKATFANTCPACKGYGNVISGSLVPEKRAITCRECNGWGYVQIDGPQPHPSQIAAPIYTAPSADTPENAQPERDPWGRERGDPNFGVLAGYER